MRMLHTSDWHLGRRFHRADLLSAQTAFLDHLVEVVISERIDLVVVAGDVYDRALPAVDAVSLLDDALSHLTSAGTRVVLSSGNHDSARRLGFGSRLLESAGVHVRTSSSADRIADPVLLPDRYGNVAVYPLPYLEPAVLTPDDLDDSPTGEPEHDDDGAARRSRRSHDAVLGAAMAAVRRDAATRPGARTIVGAHAFVVGGLPSDSERDISVAGVQAVAAEVFTGIDYVALGHLHRPQEITPVIRYSGSPLPFSFSEHGQVKGSWLVDLGPDSVTKAEFIPAPVHRPLAVLRGELARLLTDPVLAGHEDAWCQVTLTDVHRPAQAMPRIRERFPHTLELRFEPAADGGRPARSSLSRIRERSDLEICTGFLDHVRTRPASADETAWLSRALQDHRVQQAETSREPLPSTGPGAP